MFRRIRRFLHVSLIVMLTVSAVGVAVLWAASIGKPTMFPEGGRVSVFVYEGYAILLSYEPFEPEYTIHIDLTAPPSPLFIVERSALLGQDSLVIGFPLWGGPSTLCLVPPSSPLSVARSAAAVAGNEASASSARTI